MFVFLLILGLLISVVSLVLNNSYDEGTTRFFTTRITSYIGVVLLTVSLVFFLHDTYFGIEKKNCDKAGGLWVGEYDICIDKAKLPVLEMKK